MCVYVCVCVCVCVCVILQNCIYYWLLNCLEKDLSFKMKVTISKKPSLISTAGAKWAKRCSTFNCCHCRLVAPTLCDPMDCSLPGSFVHGISQARILEWVAISFSRGSSRPRDRTYVSCVAGRLRLSHFKYSIPNSSISPWNRTAQSYCH